MKKVSVGIVGYGRIGSALGQWLADNNGNCTVLISDPPKGYNESLLDVDAVFVSIHIPTEADGTQNIDLLRKIIIDLPDCPIFVRTTLLPGTCDRLRDETGKSVYFMPEFLTERTAYRDFCSQPMVFTGEVDLLRAIFPGKAFVEMTSLEAEIAKYAHNVFGAVKVTYFNGIHKIARAMGCDYEKIRQGVLLSSYINAEHTLVPGPDGKYGYGGKCFPKDVNAFACMNANTSFGNMLDLIMNINAEYRDQR